MYFVKRMENLQGDGVVGIRKPEQMAESILIDASAVIGIELDLMNYNMVKRLQEYSRKRRSRTAQV